MTAAGGRQAAATWPVMAVALGLVVLAWRSGVGCARQGGERRTGADAARLAAEVDARRLAERAMRDTEQRFRAVVEASPIALMVAGANGRVMLANPQAERLFGYTDGTLPGCPVDALVAPSQRDAHAALRAAYLEAPARRPMGAGRDLRGVRRDGREIPVEIGLSPIVQGATTSVLMSVVDLGDRLDAQHRTEAMLREKTVLLDEVHHRVNNNLQVITSLLSLQARGAPPAVQDALGECRHRVRAMALTHQLLHEHADVARLDVGEYLRRLGRLLADGYRGQAPGVALRVEARDVPLHLDLPRAIPCGLLVNELVGHAYRHAFPGGRGGTIEVGLALDPTGQARLWVADDGLGAPVDVDPAAAPPLGLQLVPLLVDQLGGTLERGGGPGSRVEVRFPAIAETAR